MDHELGDPINCPQTGKDLQAWRRALGLIGVTPNTISQAERDKGARLKGKVLVAVQLLQHRIVHGEIDLSPIFKERIPRGRPRKKR
jgi:hypothetical protein